MAVTTLKIPLDAVATRLFTAASSEEQEKLRLLVSFWLREFLLSPTPLSVFMDEMSAKAQARGLTPEILETLLQDA